MPGLRHFFPLILVPVGALLASCVTSPHRPTASYTLTDLTGDYLDFFDRTRDLATGARVAAFKSDIGTKFPGFYDTGRIPDVTPAQYDALIARSFEEFPGRREAFTRTAAEFQSMLRPAIDSFAATFTDLHDVRYLALVHSLGEMDGGTRLVNGKTWLIFGADVMARLHPPGEERPFFHHELFHVYNGQFFAECEPLWCALWSEGLAVLVSERLNPGATDADLMLTSPAPIRASVDAHLADAVCAIRARLDSRSQQDYASFFLGNSRFADLPARAGYYLGYRVMKLAAVKYSLAALAHMDHEHAREALDAALGELATCR